MDQQQLISPDSKYYIKLYHGYGHTHDLLLYGHVFEGDPVPGNPYSNSALTNMRYLWKLFSVKPVAGVPLMLRWQGNILRGITESDGFVRFEWDSPVHLPAGWHEVGVNIEGNKANAKGVLFVPHITQYAFISDIDDTVLISYSSTVWRRLKTLFTTNPRTRQAFEGVGDHYRLLANAHTTSDTPNPFFYVSSSEWNLYDYLVDFFRHQGLPEGAFLLNQVKRWYEVFKTGKTKHKGKLIRVMRIIDTFPEQRFILLGDNTQQDADIYTQIAEKYPERIYAIYIRNASEKNAVRVSALLNDLEKSKGIFTCQFNTSEEAVEHSRSIGLVE